MVRASPRAMTATLVGNARNSQAASAINGNAAMPEGCQTGPSSVATSGWIVTAITAHSGNARTLDQPRQRSTPACKAGRSCCRSDSSGSISRHCAVKASSRTASTRRNAMCTWPSAAAPAVAPISSANRR